LAFLSIYVVHEFIL